MSKCLAAGLCVTGLLAAPSPASASLPVPDLPIQLPLPGDTAPLPSALDPILDSLASAVPTAPTVSTSAPALPGAPISGQSAGVAPAESDLPVAPTAAVVPVDAHAPSVRVSVGSRLRRAALSGRLKLHVTASEPGVVALGVLARPVVRGRVAPLMRFAPVVLAYRQAGRLTASLRLSRGQRRALRRARGARLSLTVLAVDVARNQATFAVRRRVRR